jgi:hypothetical protein
MNPISVHIIAHNKAEQVATAVESARFDRFDFMIAPGNFEGMLFDKMNALKTHESDVQKTLKPSPQPTAHHP